jgi:hypothetical protein
MNNFQGLAVQCLFQHMSKVFLFLASPSSFEIKSSQANPIPKDLFIPVCRWINVWLL